VAKFTVVTAQQLKKTLARKFVPLADSLRDLLTKFGLRTYRVSIVRERWSGGQRGVGAVEIISVVPILPTPKMSDLSSLTEIVQPIGLDEVGSAELSEISGRYTEEELRGLEADGTEVGPDTEIYYEVEFPRVDGGPSIKRRFFIRGVPNYNPGGLQWSVNLEKASEDRMRNGDSG
jgi:hypothetical protein